MRDSYHALPKAFWPRPVLEGVSSAKTAHCHQNYGLCLIMNSMLQER
jgi:hypothetical protein